MRLLLRVFFGYDVAFGMLWCVLVSLFFAESFNPFILGFSVVCAISPDFDFVPWKILRKKYKIQCHQNIFHHPILLIPLMIGFGSIFAHLIGAKMEIVSGIAVGGLMFHFVHDSLFFAGLHWLGPFSWTRTTFRRGFFEKVPKKMVDDFYKKQDKMEEGTRGFVEALTKRSAGTEAINVWKIVFWLFSAGCVCVFAI